jgi:hypothetical protein
MRGWSKLGALGPTQESSARFSIETVMSPREHLNLIPNASGAGGINCAGPLSRTALRTRASIGSICLTVAIKDWRIASRRSGSIAAAKET